MRGWFFSGHPIINVTNGLSPLFCHPNWVRRHWGFRYPPWVSRMYIWNQSVPAPSPAPPLPGGQLEGPPKATEGLLLPVEAGSPPWWGVDAFPLCLGAAVIPLWPEVAGRPPWLGVGSCLLPLGAG